MTPLNAITGMTTEAADLLLAVGIRSVAHLASVDASKLHPQLEILAWQRGRTAMAPPREMLEQWMAIARMLTPQAEAEAVKMESIPEAVTVPPIQAAWIPPALRAAQEATGILRSESDPAAVLQQSAAAENSWRRVDPSQFATIEAYNEGRIGVQPLSRESIKDSPPPVEAAEDDEDDDGKRRPQRIRSNGDSLSRWVRRGVVHPRPFHTWLAAAVSLVWRIALVAGVAGFLWLITSSRQPSAHTAKVAACFVALIVLGCLQLHFAGRSRCRICSCNLFYSKNCHKNRKAHLIYGLGYVASAALHLLVYGWFRCMYCGTAIRLSPGRQR